MSLKIANKGTRAGPRKLLYRYSPVLKSGRGFRIWARHLFLHSDYKREYPDQGVESSCLDTGTVYSSIVFNFICKLQLRICKAL